jgi:hypothetical protein
MNSALQGPRGQLFQLLDRPATFACELTCQKSDRSHGPRADITAQLIGAQLVDIQMQPAARDGGAALSNLSH